jgi:hypothetical protein
MFVLNRIERQKRKLRGVYLKYVKHVQELSCGETLANYIDSTARKLRQKLAKEYKKMRELDPQCPSLDIKLLQ